MGIWDNFETALDSVGGGAPATGGALPWASDGGGGVTYKQHVAPEGPYGSVYPAGTLYSVGTNGSVSVDYTPPKGSSSGGTTNYNTIMSGTLGAGRYTQGVDTDGSRTGYPGATYQFDNLDGSITIINKGTGAGNDPDGDGYDNSTGLPVGVKSVGGKLYYQGQEVNPDGSLATPTSPKAGTWTGYGPKGQGTYYLDGPGGTAGTYIGPTTAGSTSSGASYSVPKQQMSAAEQASVARAEALASVMKSKAQGTLNAEDDARAAQMAKDARDAAYAFQTQDREDDQLFKSGESALDRALRLQESAAQNAQRQEDRRLAAVDTFGKGLTAYDAKAYFDALGEAGYDINNLVKGGTNLLTDNALTPSAAALGIIRGVSGPAAASGLPSVPGEVSPGVPGGVTSSVPGPVASSGLSTAGNMGVATPEQMAAQRAARVAKDLDREFRTLSHDVATDPLLRGGIPYSEYGMRDESGFTRPTYGSPGAYQPGATQTMDPTLPGYVDPRKQALEAQAARLGGSAQGPTGEPGGLTPMNRQPGVVLPGVAGGASDDPRLAAALNDIARAKGGPVASSGLAVVGDDVSGRPTGHEELVIDPTADSTVVPLNREGLAAAGGLQRFATGGTMTSGMMSRTRTPYIPSSHTPATTGLPPVAPVQPTPVAPTQPAAPAQTTPSAPTGITGVPAPNTPAQPVATQPAAPVAPQQPVASTGLPVTPQPDQSLLDEIAKQRRDTILLGGPGMYSLKFGGMSDLYRSTYAQNMAQKYGIPEEEILFQAQKARRGLGGVAASGLSTPLGY